MKKGKSLFIVDDDDLFIYLIKKSIEMAHIAGDIKVFKNGLDAMNFIKENLKRPELLPDVLFLDLSMPVMDGWQFLEEYVRIIPETDYKIKIYIVSSSISPYDISRASSITAVSDFLIKPITREKLIELITKM